MLKLHERAKEAALLYDEVVFEDGEYVATVGPTSSVEILGPSRQGGMTRRREARQRGGDFWVAIDGRTVIHDETERHYVAENRSVIDQIQNAWGGSKLPEWVRIEAFQAPSDLKGEIRRLARRDVQTRGLWRRAGGEKLRDLVLYNLNHDLILGACLQTFISPDSYFSPLLRRKRGVALSKGHLALQVCVPDFGSMSWENILEAREHPGMDDLRSKLVEIEEEVAEAAGGRGSFESAILRHTLIDLARESRPPTGLTVSGRVVLDLVMGTLGPVGAAASALLSVTDAAQQHHTWRAAFLRLMDLASRQGG